MCRYKKNGLSPTAFAAARVETRGGGINTFISILLILNTQLRILRLLPVDLLISLIAQCDYK